MACQRVREICGTCKRTGLYVQGGTGPTRGPIDDSLVLEGLDDRVNRRLLVILTIHIITHKVKKHLASLRHLLLLLRAALAIGEGGCTRTDRSHSGLGHSHPKIRYLRWVPRIGWRVCIKRVQNDPGLLEVGEAGMGGKLAPDLLDASIDRSR
jgi:hypothetical protein